MGIELTLIGRRDGSGSSETFLSRAARWIGARDVVPQPSVRVEDGAVIAELHPAAEAIAIEAPDARTVVLRAKTGTCGPGYHRFVCELARGLGDALAIAWSEEEDGDLTDWFFREDEAALEDSFLDWLGGVAAQLLELEGRSHFSISLPAGYVFEHDGIVATPMGPRDLAWVKRVVDDPRAGIDVFPWWSSERDGRYHLGLALTDMWTSVRWRVPLDDAERALLDRVATAIERAHAMDPSLLLPWREQSEILTLLSEESLRATRAHLKADSDREPRAPIGYRRNPVRVELTGGWSMRIPGELAERWEDERTWVGWDARRSIWFNSLTVRTDRGDPSPSTEATLTSLPTPSGDEILELERGDLRGLAAFVDEEDDGQPVTVLEAIAAQGMHAAVGTIVLVDPSDQHWALDTWGSLRR